MDFPHFDLTVDNHANKDATLLKDILALVKPNWDLRKVELQDLSRYGYVNVNIICRHEGDAVFVRVTNPISVILYNDELELIRKFVAKQGFSAKLLCTFNNGFVEECLEGEPITWQTTKRVHEEDIKRGIAQELARYHTRDVLKDAEKFGIQHDVPLLRPRHLDYLWEDIERCAKIEMSVLDSLPSKDVFTEELKSLNARFDQLGAEKAVCHFDTNAANVFILKGGRVIFTDYETVCISYSAADVGYYLLLTDFDQVQVPVLTCPDEEYRREFCKEYLNQKRKIANDSRAVTDEELDMFVKQVDVGMVMALLLFTNYSYTFLTDQFNTPIPTDKVLQGIQALWPIYHGMKEDAFK